MSNFKAKEWVLINSAEGKFGWTFTLARIERVEGDIACIDHGHFTTKYHFNNLHKAPKSLIKTVHEAISSRGGSE